MSFSTNEIRSTFLSYFADCDHKILRSASLVPESDPTLLFTNAGMVPFKNIFAGHQKPPSPRATTAQKVVRAGGKHNDLDNVGYTARHHTFFEMMGNFSFGDYFKEQAIKQAWDLLTRGFGISPWRLLVTVYAEDVEAASLWKKIAGLPDEKIIRINTMDNFWRMGDTGPCGPCSEIFYDHGDKIFGGPPGSKDEDGDRFTEIWNLVFMQYYEEAGKERALLPKPSIDTGMGLERFAAVMQGKQDNFDTDQFQALIRASADLLGQSANGPFKNSHRVTVDHLRSTAFLIADGVLPDREGRGYVLRRIMRRAMRHLHKMGANEPVFYRLLPALIEQMGNAYPELAAHKSLIEQTIKTEEENFISLLGRGMGLLDETLKTLSVGQTLSGAVAFRLYDTYGFPFDLTRDILREKNIKIDEAGFEAEMAAQKQRARASWTGSGDRAANTDWIKALEDRAPSLFEGYETHRSESRITAVFRDAEERASAEAGEEIVLLLDKTPFYGESGGQAGDQGTLTGGNGLKIEIFDAKRHGDQILHYGLVKSGTVEPGMKVTAVINSERRDQIARHHSATHLLHQSLRDILGGHITQKGSLNAPERLRFDISHPRPLTADEISAVEASVNRHIRRNVPVKTRIMNTDDARMEGAMALFGEKYGDKVRVVSIGDAGNGEKAWSLELCGGTHVGRTGEIGQFKIVSEAGVSAGVRRIEAVCGQAAEVLQRDREQILARLSELLKTNFSELPERLENLLTEHRERARRIAELQKDLALIRQKKNIQTIGGVSFLFSELPNIPPKELKSLAVQALGDSKNRVVALMAGEPGKVTLTVAISEDLTKRLHAGDIVKKASALMDGKGGGGKPGLAQTGGAKMAGAAVSSMIGNILESL